MHRSGCFSFARLMALRAVPAVRVAMIQGLSKALSEALSKALRKAGMAGWSGVAAAINPL